MCKKHILIKYIQMKINTDVRWLKNYSPTTFFYDNMYVQEEPDFFSPF